MNDDNRENQPVDNLLFNMANRSDAVESIKDAKGGLLIYFGEDGRPRFKPFDVTLGDLSYMATTLQAWVYSKALPRVEFGVQEFDGGKEKP